MSGELCGAATRSGGRCSKQAGWGTEHVGVGKCRLHGGSTPTHQRRAAREMAVVMGAEHDIEPQDALLWCIRIAAGEVNYCSAQIAELEAADAVGHPVVEVERAAGDAEGTLVERRRQTVALNIWIRARQDAVERLARFSKMALDAGVAERQVRVAERYGQQIAQLLAGVLAELDLNERQQRRAPDVVRRHLVLLEGGQAQRAA